MDIALIASGNVEVHSDNVSPGELMDALFMTYSQMCKDKGLDLKLSLPEKSDGFLLKTDQELLKKILTHLLDNAVKFTHQGHIHFGYSINEPGIEFFVTDTGTGISKDFQNRIFERFAQEDPSLTRKFEGSGLGLAIVKGLCDLLDAKIHLVSQKDYGTSFYIGFSTSGSEKKEKIPAIQPEQTSQPIILIAEDEIDNFAYLEIVLKKFGAAILHAVNGKEAVDLCQAHPEINIVFMDLKMPVMNGLEATRIIKSHRKDLPIVAVTAYAMSGDERRALSGGCDDYVSKPVKKDMILSKLRKYGLYNK
jgi:CheY-like chemotaxis protein/two-component sensor histidine kinase